MHLFVFALFLLDEREQLAELHVKGTGDSCEGLDVGGFCSVLDHSKMTASYSGKPAEYLLRLSATAAQSTYCLSDYRR